MGAKPVLGCYYVLAICGLAFVAVYMLWQNQLYQAIDQVVATPRIKVKGSATWSDEVGKLTFDSADLTSPMVKTDHAFITTNLHITRGQQRAVCEGGRGEGTCSCPLGELERCCRKNERGVHGVKTGKCGASGKFCEVEAWCPLEKKVRWSDQHLTTIPAVKDWIVMIAMNARFPKFDLTVSGRSKNAIEESVIELDQGASHVTLQELALMAGANYTLMAIHGGEFLIRAEYDCDFDKLKGDKCTPKIDVQAIVADMSLHAGRKYIALKPQYKGEYRDMFKMTGIFVHVHAYGKARRYDLKALLFNAGACLGLLVLLSVLCIGPLILNADTGHSDDYDETDVTPTDEQDDDEEDDDSEEGAE